MTSVGEGMTWRIGMSVLRSVEREQPENIGQMLSDMSLLQDGGRADPAYDSDWSRDVDFALAGGTVDPLTFVSEPGDVN